MKRILAITAIALSALVLTGCARGAGQESSYPASQPGTVQQAEDGSSPLDAGGSVGVTERAVITTGTVSLTVDDPIAGAESAAQLIDKAGGRVDARSESPATDSRSANASLSLRIPSTKFEDVLAQLKELGTVNYISLDATDVTQQVDDIDARIAALETSVTRLTELMAQAQTTADLIAIEESLSSRQVELDGLIAQRDYLADQVSYSTINLELYSVGTIAPGDPDNFWSGFIAGWNALVSGLGAFLVGLGFMLPGLIFLAVLAGIALAIILPIVRRKRHTKRAAIDAWNAEQTRLHAQAQSAAATQNQSPEPDQTTAPEA